MPNWHQLLSEIKISGSTYDITRRKYLKQLHELTGRNIILYYSGWLQKRGLPGTDVNDADKTGFMTTIDGLDKSKGLDLFLHTPGGETAATESLVDYIRSMFGTNIRAIIPQLALSAGTMIACACREIVLGKQSSLGPIDPQFRGLPAHGIVEEFTRAHEEITRDGSKLAVWRPIIEKYHPTLVGECEKAIEWATEMVTERLLTGMFKDEDNVKDKIDSIVEELGDHALTKSHARHLSLDKCKEIGLKITALEDDDALQNAVLSVHHACIHTLSSTDAYKIIENHDGIAFIQMTPRVIMSA